jgi:hypothetical protein
MEKPSWWTDTHTSVWEHVKEALRRDWEQTKHDLHAGGHEMNQTASDTLSQGVGEAPIPPIELANRPTVVDSWEDAEMAIGFGYAARNHYGDVHPTWSSELAHKLAHDWKNAAKPWSKVEIYVRHGYELRH